MSDRIFSRCVAMTVLTLAVAACGGGGMRIRAIVLPDCCSLVEFRASLPDAIADTP